MEKRKLGSSGLEVSVIGFGAWAAGKVGWGRVTESELEEAIIRAYEEGVNFFDTAPVYGFGESERLLGRVLKPFRKQVIIATKFGLVWDANGIHNDVSAAGARREVDESLKRLGTDYIDLYQVHWPDPTGKVPIAETIGALKDLVQEGKIRHIGVSNFSVEQLREAQAIAPIVSLQSPYNLLQRKAERLKEIAAKYGKTPGQVALRWLAANPAVTSIIAGAKTAAQVEENVGGVGWDIDDPDLRTLDAAFRDE
ncbi:aldo/keto reductase [Cohnella laeviribosi]|uniref:aldo/keto reductase n=1 Tax=Cohnella laeviribosi TaxID=380174 RepID=UPI00037991B2|nr:aldo/keto reductase [Cohnella laeviribosi]